MLQVNGDWIWRENDLNWFLRVGRRAQSYWFIEPKESKHRPISILSSYNTNNRTARILAVSPSQPNIFNFFVKKKKKKYGTSFVKYA